MKTKIFKAFTLIELLIVIVIIGILATALIPRVTGVQNKARYARVEKDFRDFRTAVLMAQANTNKSLKDITGTSHTAGWMSCWDGTSYLPDFRNLPYSHLCRSRFRDALEKISVAASMGSGALLTMELDPRGSPYILDENEGENPGDLCNPDNIFSVGPDGKASTSDDKVIIIAPQGCPSSY